MLVFCPTCGYLLKVEEGSFCNTFKCQGCEYTLPISKEVKSRVYPRLKDLDEVLGGPGAWENAQITDESCPHCKHPKAYFMQLQTRSADEPMTIFYRCANAECAQHWRE